MKFTKLLVVIPTRNRADFAIRAINSVLKENGENYAVLVSDNSTDEQESNTLFSFCEKLNDTRLTYLRPEEPLSMTKHWDWVMSQAFLLVAFSHVLYLTDRMVFLRDGLSKLQEILKNFPDSVVSYHYDDIDDTSSPVYLFQPLRTGALFEIDSSRMLELYANAKRIPASPRMLNSVVPGSLMLLVKQRTGNYFSSVCPDYNFAFTCLSLCDRILYYDDTILLGYGRNRSNGINMLNGTFQKDSIDFIQNMESTDVCFPTPVKTIFLSTNAILHEYCFVKESAIGDGKFREINQRYYLISLVLDVVSYRNREMRKGMWGELISVVGWPLHCYSIYSQTLQHLHGLRVRFYNLFNPSTPYIRVSLFAGIDQAIEYANIHPRDIDHDLRFLDQRTGPTHPRRIPLSIEN